jgi:hypothetical protein
MLSSSDTNELAPAFHTGSLERPCVPCVQQNTRLRAFWPEPVSIFGSLGLTMLMAVHLYWAFHPACPSDRIDARSLGNHLTAFSASKDVRILSRQLPTKPLPVLPVPVGYCERNRRFGLCFLCHIKQSL